jgi:hypothetical protein
MTTLLRDVPKSVEDWRAAVASRERLDSLIIRRMAQLTRLGITGTPRSFRILMRAWLDARNNELTA